MSYINTFKRLNITLSPETWERLEKTTSPRERSRFIDEAVRVYLTYLKRKVLKKSLKKEALASSVEDLKIVKEWFSLDAEAWDKIR